MKRGSRNHRPRPTVRICVVVPLLWLVAGSPTPAPAQLAAARQAAARGDHELAVDGYRRFLDGDPDHAAAWAELARSLLLLQRPDEALQACEQGLQRAGPGAPLLRVAGGVYASQGRYALAIAALDSALALDPGDAATWANLGGLHSNLGQFARAEAALRRATELAPGEPLAWRRLGVLELKRGRHADAISHLRAAFDLQADEETGFLLAQAAEGDGDLPLALAHYDGARRLDPSHMQAHYRTGLLARRLDRAGLADSAMAAYRHLQALGTPDPKVLKRFQALRDAVAESGGQADHLYELAVLLADHGYGDEARNRFQAVLARRPGDYRALNHVGNLYLQARRADEALTAYEEALRHHPGFAPALLNAGNACMILGQPQRALGYFQRSVAAAPEVPMAWFGLAAAHLELGRPATADSLAGLGLRRAPAEGPTKQALLHLQRKARSARR